MRDAHIMMTIIKLICVSTGLVAGYLIAQIDYPSTEAGTFLMRSFIILLGYLLAFILVELYLNIEIRNEQD